jgi:cation diffusion facilitator CzcD-associated flavoprotein CzcO
MTTPPSRADVVVVGAGFSGVCAGARLRQDFPSLSVVIFEKEKKLGGTWSHAGAYPGASCDVPSHAYSLSFARNPHWSTHFARQPEIAAYLQTTADKFGVTPLCSFGRLVVDCVWDETAREWRVTTVPATASSSSSSSSASSAAAATTTTCRYLIVCNAPLCEPVFPSIPGRESFRGAQFHTARYDWAFNPAGKRVAVVGTGASAAQCVPELVKTAAHVTVYQRTPAWVVPRWDFPYPSFVRLLFSWLPPLALLYRLLLLAYHEIRYFGFIRPIPGLSSVNKSFAALHLKASVADPALRAALTPNYALGCKRVILSDAFYPALTRPNASLVPGGVARVTPTGVVGADGVERPVDAIIYATGFDIEASAKLARIVGKGGVALKEAWDARGGPEAYLGIVAPACPNLFFTLGPNTGLGHSSVVTMIEIQVDYICKVIGKAEAEGWGAVEVRADANDAYQAALQRDLASTVWSSGCVGWYTLGGRKNVTMWPHTVTRYWSTCRTVDWSAFSVEEGKGKEKGAR